MKCPNCSHEFGSPKGGLILVSDQTSTEQRREDQKEPPKSPVRGKAREYSKAFEIAWKAYPRREQKFEAFAIWNVRAREIGETELLTLIMVALNWQKKGWSKEVWYRPPYFERYLKRRKWEDEPSPAPDSAPRRVDDGMVANTAKKIAEINSYADKRPSADQLASLRPKKEATNG